MTNFTTEQITNSIDSLTKYYQLLKQDPNQFDACVVIFTTICTLEAVLKYEPSLQALELPFSIESIRKPEYV
jgi:hypothetical protein